MLVACFSAEVGGLALQNHFSESMNFNWWNLARFLCLLAY